MTTGPERVERTGTIGVLIADDEPELRGALADLISSEDHLRLVGVAADADEAIELAISTGPDVALVDVRMPAGGGPRATREILRASPGTRVLALSAYEDRATVLEMLRAGAVGYLVKGTAPDEIVRAVERAARGQTSLSAEVMAGVVQELSTQLRREELAAEERRSQVSRVRRAVAGEGLAIVFQPIFDLRDRRIVGLEALARFSLEPARPPVAWFQEAASVGLGVDLEVTAIERALAEFPRLPPDAYLSLNVSQATALSSRCRDLLTGAEAARIVVEITEHERVEDYDALLEALDGLRGLGARIAIDDAGAGFASLRHTLRLDPDLIKLDISLTRDIDADRARRALASALISFAEEMGMTIVAEGIERQAELDTLLRLGVRYGQGFFLAKPGPLPDR
ncbi:MAG TPA: EAL domain-containing protein [Actinomycetota bacterium]|nr:EAL domain-containing protein [Actinomycetota bacterium]